MQAIRVLVIEDDSDIATLMSEVLLEIGCVVCGIEVTEAEAEAAAVRLKPDLMIVDAQLQSGSGISAVARILAFGFIPHVFVSGNIARVIAQRPQAVTLQKPFRVPELARAIRDALDVVPDVASSETHGNQLLPSNPRTYQ